MEDVITNVWNEVRVTDEGISITLLSESLEGGAIVEDETWFTFDEMRADSPQSPISLSLSGETDSALAEQRRMAQVGELVDSQESDNSQELPEVGDCLTDQNPPSWASDSDYLEVVEVLPNTRCDEHIIQGPNEGKSLEKGKHQLFDKTVADANPSYNENEPVVMAQYNGSGDWYAFPASRLSDE
jgi:hypothetical protein